MDSYWKPTVLGAGMNLSNKDEVLIRLEKEDLCIKHLLDDFEKQYK